MLKHITNAATETGFGVAHILCTGVKNSLTVEHAWNLIIELLRKEFVDSEFYWLNCGWTATTGSV